MTIWQKAKNIFGGIVMILLSLLLMFNGSGAFQLICILLCLWLFVYGIKAMVYYQTMARHMVGGRIQLYRGIILLNFGMFTLSLNTIPKAYIILYLMGIHAFSGLVDILRAREAKQLDAPAWKGSMFSGVGNLVIALLCITIGFMQKSTETVVYVYSAGLFYSGMVRIISAFKKTEIIYIQ